jgi:hypothetical protein
MSDILRDAEAAQAALQTYGGQVEDGIHEDKAVALAVCLSADAICEYLAALVRAVEGTQ